MKSVPQRQCIGCGERRDKGELVRIVAGEDKMPVIDPTGKLPGRGAYLCRNVSCLAKAQKKNALTRALKQSVPQAAYEALSAEIAMQETGKAAEGGAAQ